MSPYKYLSVALLLASTVIGMSHGLVSSNLGTNKARRTRTNMHTKSSLSLSSTSTSTLSKGKEEIEYNPIDYTSTPTKQKDVCIIGGGPVGLSTAIMLASPPHNYNCVVIEANRDVNNFNPGRGFMYNVNSRGRKLTQSFPDVDAKLKEMGVKSDFGRFCIIPADPNEALPEVAQQAGSVLDNDSESGGDDDDDDDFVMENNEGSGDAKVSSGIKEVIKSTREKGGNAKSSYWIQRHDFTRLLRDYSLEEVNKNSGGGSVEVIAGSKCVNVFPSTTTTSGESDGGVEALIQDMKTGDFTKYSCNLIVGADGYRSKVRNFLSKRDAPTDSLQQSTLWEKFPNNKFHVKQYKSPATHLRLKVLQFPPQFPIPDADSSDVKTNGKYIYGVRSINKGPTNFVSLGILPIKDNNAIRPVNVIARPNHDLWKIKDPEEVRQWFQTSFPRMNFSAENGLLPKEEWERFVMEEGTRFPHCQYTNGVASSSVDKKSAVVLLGDALHSYPPDIGQGVNSGLADVIGLGKALENVNLSIKGHDTTKPKQVSLGDAMKKFEKNRLAETKALIKLARFGSPYQYNQPLYIDRIGKKLWTMNVFIRVFLNKVSFGVVPKPAIMISQDPDLTFKQIMFRADVATFCLGTVTSWLLKKLFWKRLLKYFMPSPL